LLQVSATDRTLVKSFHHRLLRRNVVGIGEKSLVFGIE
jgi:hypothetical protein